MSSGAGLILGYHFSHEILIHSHSSPLIFVNLQGIHPIACGIIPADAGNTDSICILLRSHGPLLGIIPADAGSTGRLRPWQPSSQDHPRGCEEHMG